MCRSILFDHVLNALFALLAWGYPRINTHSYIHDLAKGIVARDSRIFFFAIAPNLPTHVDQNQGRTDRKTPTASNNRDTLSTVEIVEQTLGQVRLQEQIKLDCIQALIEEHFDTARFLQALGLTTS